MPIESFRWFWWDIQMCCTSMRESHFKNKNIEFLISQKQLEISTPNLYQLSSLTKNCFVQNLKALGATDLDLPPKPSKNSNGCGRHIFAATPSKFVESSSSPSCTNARILFIISQLAENLTKISVSCPYIQRPPCTIPHKAYRSTRYTLLGQSFSTDRHSMI